MANGTDTGVDVGVAQMPGGDCGAGKTVCGDAGAGVEGLLPKKLAMGAD